MRFLQITIVAFLLLAAPASAYELPVPPQAIVHDHVYTPVGASPVFIAALDQQLSSVTMGDDIYISPAWPKWNYEFALWHEYGHVFNHNYLSRRAERRIGKWMPKRDWDEEYFADVYANVALGHSYKNWESNYGFVLRSQHAYRKLSRILQDIARRSNI
jgi:hypothetical protein